MTAQLYLYATLKGVPKALMEREVTDKITEVGLTARRDYYANALSGGMQRKLSVAMALVGGSKVVFLGTYQCCAALPLIFDSDSELSVCCDQMSRAVGWTLTRAERCGSCSVAPKKDAPSF